jgi:E2/UBC family protein E
MKFGVERLCEDLGVLGLKADLFEDPQKNVFVIVQGYLIELGRFAGRVIDLGLLVPANYPQGVGSCIHVKAAPQLLDVTDTVPNVRNVTASSLGQEWRYWSKNFGWNGERSTRRLMSQVNEIFLHA